MILTKNVIKRIKFDKTCIFGRFPYISNIKCLYKGVFCKIIVLYYFLPLRGPKTKFFLEPWYTLHTTKVVNMAPPKIFFGNKIKDWL